MTLIRKPLIAPLATAALLITGAALVVAARWSGIRHPDVCHPGYPSGSEFIVVCMAIAALSAVIVCGICLWQIFKARRWVYRGCWFLVGAASLVSVPLLLLIGAAAESGCGLF